MNSRMDQFRIFVSKHPLLRDEVRNQKLTWQNIYEEWVLYGEENEQWKAYEAPTSNENSSNQTNQTNQANNIVNLDSIKSIVNYIQKLNPDTVNKTLNTVQKVIQIVQTVNGGSKTPIPGPMINSMYSDWWD